MFKRLLAVVLVLVMAALLSVQAFAQEEGAVADLGAPFGQNMLTVGCDTFMIDPTVWGMMAEMLEPVADECGLPPTEPFGQA